MMKKKFSSSNGFTLVEVITVIIIIGILSAITVVAYNGISRRAQVLSLVSDLTNASDMLKVFQSKNTHFPSTINCNEPDSSTNLCIEASKGNSFIDYSFNNSSDPQTVAISSTNDADTYRTTDTSKKPIPCMTGAIIIPGSETYDTDDFCVMKYEAKNASGVPISSASGAIWSGVTQVLALSESQTACYENCHLLSEAEWLTIAQNVMGVADNWSSGEVGNGYIFSGHNDGAPASPQLAEAFISNEDDVNGYSGTGNVSPSSQRRTLVLSNGEVIWDLAGNVDEWTSNVHDGGQPGLTGFDYDCEDEWINWYDVDLNTTQTPSPFPSDTGISGADGWNGEDNGIGRLCSSATDTDPWAYVRGGNFDNYDDAGVMAAAAGAPTVSEGDEGFRVAR